MTRHPKGSPDLAAMSGAVFLALVAILAGLTLFAQCNLPTPTETDPSEARIIDTGRATCEPWPQCQDVEPPKQPETP